MKRLLLILLGLMFAGCEAQATPIASIITPSATPEPTTISVPELRYGIAENIAPYAGDLSFPFEILDSSRPLTEFDLVVAYGIYDGWQVSPQSHRVSLAINPALSPLDDMTIRDLIPAVINVQAIVDGLNIPGAQQTNTLSTETAEVIRTTLANAGYPDGFQLTMATESLPAVDVLVQQFSDLSMDIRLIELTETTFGDNRAHLGLFIWSNESERAEYGSQVGEDNIIDLWTMPVSYLNNGGVTIEFTDNGIPVPVR